MKHALLCATSALFLMTGTGWAAPADQPGNNPQAGTDSGAMSGKTAGAAGTVPAHLTNTTRSFVDGAAISDMYEVAAGKIALQKAESPQVKGFAQHMVSAHTQTTEELKRVLANNNSDIRPPAQVDPRRQAMLDELRHVKSADFDHRYIAQQIAAHREADTLFRRYASNGDNPALRSFAAKTDQVIKSHLAMAEKLRAQSRSASNQ